MSANKQVGLSFCPETLAYLDTKVNKSAYVRDLVRRDQEGLALSDDLRALMLEYRGCFGQDPEIVFGEWLRKRMAKLKSNLSLPVELKDNQVGRAFQQLDLAFDEIKVKNEGEDDVSLKVAITFGALLDVGGCNHNAIRRWIRVNQVKIDAYHERLGIKDPQAHNRQKGVILREKRRQDLKSLENMAGSQ